MRQRSNHNSNITSSFKFAKDMLSRSAQGCIMEEAIQTFWEKVEEGFSTLYVEESTAEVRVIINEVLVMHFGNLFAKELLRMSRSPT